MIDVQRDLRQIPLDLIDVLNPRERNERVFAEIVANIKTIGLKKPIVVTPRSDGEETRYLLVCGEGRMKAFRALGESSIPALVIKVTDEDAFLMSLSENVARRRWTSTELLSGIVKLRDAGYAPKDIAAKTGLTASYVRGILILMQNGEQRLIAAVERGDIPMNAALAIVSAGEDGKAIQAALQSAYEAGTLRGNRLRDARRVIERRAMLGHSIKRGRRPKQVDVSPSSLVRMYEKEVQRQKSMVRKATLSQQRLLFTVTALQQLFRDEDFLNLLRAERLDTLPQYLADRVWPDARRA